MIKLRAANEALFTGRKHSAKPAWRSVLRGLMADCWVIRPTLLGPEVRWAVWPKVPHHCILYDSGGITFFLFKETQ